MSDPDWPDVQALQNGENEGLDRLLERHRRPLQTFIHRMIGHAADADELTQETFVRVYFQIQQYQPEAPFVAWLYQIARNLCRDYFRSRAFRQRQQSTEWLPEMSDRHSIASAPFTQENLERTEKLQIAITRLPLALRACIVLTAIEGLSHKEAALRLGISPKAVENKTARAKKRLLIVLKKI